MSCFACERPLGPLPCLTIDLLNGIALTDIDPAILAQVRALVEQQQAKLRGRALPWPSKASRSRL